MLPFTLPDRCSAASSQNDAAPLVHPSWRVSSKDAYYTYTEPFRTAIHP